MSFLLKNPTMENTFADRLKKARKHAGLTQSELAEQVGIDQTSISNLERGKSQGTSFSARLAVACGVSAFWLETGNGEMVSAQGSEQEIDDIERELGMRSISGPELVAKERSAGDHLLDMLSKMKGRMSAEDQEKIRRAVAETLPAPKGPTSNVITADFSRSTVVKGDTIIIAQYDVRGAMGGGQVPSDYREFVRNLVVDKVQLDDLGLKYTSPTNLKIITGWGQSMLGTIEDKSPLIVDIGVTEFVEEGVYAFTWLNHFFIKRVQLLDAEHFQIVSDNKAFEPQKARMEDVYFQARVLGAWNFKKL